MTTQEDLNQKMMMNQEMIKMQMMMKIAMKKDFNKKKTKMMNKVITISEDDSDMQTLMCLKMLKI